MVERAKRPAGRLEIALVGKYVALHDAYISVVEALTHGGIENGVQVDVRWVDSEDINDSNAAELLAGCAGIIVPGGFGNRGIEGMISAVCWARENQVPYLGICLGMQLLFETSFEYGEHQGLGLISGQVRDIRTVLPSGLAIPHMGWNALHFPGERPRSPIFAALEEGEHVYFVHSYAGFACGEGLTAWTEYGAPLTAAVQRGNVYGTQFHPEKSGDVGLRILKAFCGLEGEA